MKSGLFRDANLNPGEKNALRPRAPDLDRQPRAATS
jgi:hypothetical protein